MRKTLLQYHISHRSVFFLPFLYYQMFLDFFQISLVGVRNKSASQMDAITVLNQVTGETALPYRSCRTASGPTGHRCYWQRKSLPQLRKSKMASMGGGAKQYIPSFFALEKNHRWGTKRNAGSLRGRKEERNKDENLKGEYNHKSWYLLLFLNL